MKSVKEQRTSSEPRYMVGELGVPQQQHPGSEVSNHGHEANTAEAVAEVFQHANPLPLRDISGNRASVNRVGCGECNGDASECCLRCRKRLCRDHVMVLRGGAEVVCFDCADKMVTGRTLSSLVGWRGEKCEGKCSTCGAEVLHVA